MDGMTRGRARAGDAPFMPSTDAELRVLRETLAARNRQIAAVHGISRLLSSSLDLDDRLRDILTVSLDAVGAVAGTIFLHRPQDDMLVFRHVVGEKAKELTGHAIPVTTGLAGAVFRSGVSQITNRPQESVEHDREVERRTGFATETMMTVPLKYQAGRPVGVIQILNKQTGDFDQNDLEVLEIIASVAAAAIETAQLAREAQTAAIAHAVGDLSHDIKNKVSPIVVGIQALRGDLDAMFAADDGTSLPRQAAAVREGYGYTFDIVMDQVDAIQEYAKLIADALKGVVTDPELEPNDPALVVEGQLLALDPVARHRGVALHRRFATVPVCRFDRFQVERAAYNLVNNALAATPRGGYVTVAIAVKPDPQFASGQALEIVVTDTGCGMAPPVLQRILRGEPRSTKPGGTGLGTRIVFNAVAAHRGRFTGTSDEGSGTSFRLALPLVLD
jgi:signal transduction histidine kinase